MLKHLLIAGCSDPSWHADGYCDDVNNNQACFFDGGDCCGGIINYNYCTECLCLEGGGTTPSGGCYPAWISDGYCDDVNNNLACNYDGGDCCGGIIDPNYCTECLCLEGGGGSSGGTTTLSSSSTSSGSCDNMEWNGNVLLGDGYCDDHLNIMVCNYDEGDCCGSNVNTQYCTECQCLEGGGGSTGTTTPSGTTASGGCNQGWIGDHSVGDGYCDDINNNLACAYDGGDCCLIVRISLTNEILNAGYEYFNGDYELSIMSNGKTSWINGDYAIWYYSDTEGPPVANSILLLSELIIHCSMISKYLD